VEEVMKIAVDGTVGAVLLLAVATASAQDGPAVEVTHLTDHLYQLTTDQGSYTTNSIASVGGDGVLLVDTQSADDAEELRKAVEAFGKGLPRIIINTHRHAEHVGGNAIFGEEPIVIAHDLVRTKLRSGSYLFDEFGKATLPDITLTDSLTIHFNGEPIQVTAFAGSHDDNEVIVHFTDSKVVHLSSLVNGFNFPSVDSAGDVLEFEKLVGRAIELLPEDVIIVSGHNRNGSVEELRAYRNMLLGTTEVVREGLAAGKDADTLKEEGALDPWKSYAGSYVSVDEWIDYIVGALEDKDPRKSVFEPLYYALRDGGTDAAVALYRELKREHAQEYDFNEVALLMIGSKLLRRDRLEPARRFLELSLEEYPDSRNNYYVNYQLAVANDRLGDGDAALRHCEKALELQPENETILRLLQDLKKKRG
jgi:glyoxylase-like metal-dependent hydrolase (beta-lactamase superfamily II)